MELFTIGSYELCIFVSIAPAAVVAVWLNCLGSNPNNAGLRPVYVTSTIVLGIPILVGYFAMRLRARAEMRAGYTLVDDQNVDVPLVEFQSGQLLRNAHEPALDHSEYLRRRVIARSGERSTTPGSSR